MSDPIYQHPATLLQNLIRFDTTNPPGNEAACINYINTLLTEAGVETTTLARDPKRPNLFARLKGQGNAPPLLIYGHVDVVPTTGQQWTHPPFDAIIEDGLIWGRGALDMKSGVAMMLAAFLRAKAEGTTLPGDVVFLALSDEEAGGDYGAQFLVEKHPEQFEGMRYALGEFGGFTLWLAGRPFYPIQVAEKQIGWLKLTVRGPGGHGSMPVQGGAMARLAEILEKLDRNPLPTHVTPVARQMIDAFAARVPLPMALILRQLLKPALTDTILELLGERGRFFGPLLHNTVSPTIVRGGGKINVIPSEIVLELDGRMLPGFKPGQLIAELRDLLGDDVEIDLVRYDPGPSDPDMGLFDTLASILQEADPNGIPMPLLLPGVTDGRHFSQLGIQTYGFTPMQLPKEFSLTSLAHAADERIPVAAMEFGTNAMYRALQRFGEGA